MLSDPERRARYDEVGSEDSSEPLLDSLSGWRTLKFPFSAFRDRGFYDFSEEVAHIYVLLKDGQAGPFAFELAEMGLGRCPSAELQSADWKVRAVSAELQSAG